MKRLKRAEGHLRNVIQMIEGGRTCLDIAQQLHAVEKAIAAAKSVLIHDHIDHCLEHAIGPASRKDREPIQETQAGTDTCWRPDFSMASRR